MSRAGWCKNVDKFGLVLFCSYTFGPDLELTTAQELSGEMQGELPNLIHNGKKDPHQHHAECQHPAGQDILSQVP